MEVVPTDVLVIGAGPAGLTASALLARAGVSSLTVTKHKTANSPRAHITNQRSMEAFRDLGIEEQVMDRALPQHLMGKQVFATSFAGRELGRMMTFGTSPDRCGDYLAASPTEMCNAPQHILEPIILEAALGFGADIRFDSEVVALAQDDDGVTVRVRPRVEGDEYEIRARYVIGCDGGRSTVGELGGFAYEGEGGLGNAITVWIEADLARYTAHRSGALFFVHNPGSDDVVSIWTCIEPWDEWSTIFVRHGQLENEMSEESVMARVRAAVGDPDVPITIKNISQWEFNHVVAANYRQGRLFIAGDAAHRHPPANGLGSNTSVQDAYNLAWKMAMVVSGQAGEGLLDSYNDERQPVGRQVVDRANQSVAEMIPWLGALGLQPGQTEAEGLARLDELYGPDGEEQRGELLAALELMNYQFNCHGVELGQRYTSSAVVDDDTPNPPYQRDPELYYHPTTHPGAALPHAWLGRDTHDISTLDVCNYEGFTLITGASGGAWIDAADAVADSLGVAIKGVKVALGQPNNDVLGAWTRAREVSDAGCVLVRPDRHVAWRSHDAVDDPQATLDNVVRNLLDRG
jgi:2,4-dichlorophenol 6-monooxygenase